MKVLLLRLAGPMQGWDVRQQPFIPGSRQRDIAASREDLMPTHSGVTGLLAAALGRERGQDMSDLGALLGVLAGGAQLVEQQLGLGGLTLAERGERWGEWTFKTKRWQRGLRRQSGAYNLGF